MDNESDRLWKLVVCAESDIDPYCLSFSFDRRSRGSTLVNLIGLLMDRNLRVSNLVSHGFKHLIGNGIHSEFWIDNWMGRGELKMMFPRIFAPTIVKQEPVHLFGQWNAGSWNWNAKLCRRPLDCEKRCLE